MKLNELQKFIKNFLLWSLSSGIVAILNIFVISHLSDKLGVAGFGNLNFVITYTQYFMLLASLGIDIAALRLMSTDKSSIKKIYSAIVPVKLILSLIVIVLILTSMRMVHKLENYGLVLVVYSVAIIFTPFSAQTVFEADKKAEYFSITNVFSQIINYVLIISFIKNPEHLIYAAYINLAINMLTSLIHSIIFIKKYGFYKFTFDKTLIKMLIKQGIILSLIQITVTLIHYFDVFMISFLMNDYYVGLYSAAYKAMWFITSFIGIVHNLISPILFENFKNNKAAYKNYFTKYIKFMIFFGIGLSTLLILLAKPYMSIFYNMKKYGNSVVCFKIIMVSLFFMSANSPLAIGLYSSHNEKTLLYLVTYQLLANIAGNFILIPYLGINGAAIATVITEISGLLFYIYFFKKVIEFKVLLHFFKASICIIPAILVFIFTNMHFAIKAIISSLVFLISMMAIKAYSLHEIKEVKDLLFFKR
jgi:O-antigen/teichoic acid export membrane protein